MVNIDVIDTGIIVKKQKQYFDTNETFNITFRKRQLKTLKKLLKTHESEFFQALEKDLSKSNYETFGSEIAQVIDEINYALAHLSSWARPEKVSTALVSFPSRHFVYSVPHGVTLIIGAWNYPILLTLAPLVGSMAAGNCSIVKPSELAANTSVLLKSLFEKYFEEEYIKVIEGGVEITQNLLSQDLDYIFFTGSPKVGKIIMKAAAEKLIPVTLELGGKSPCIVDEDSNLEISARRVIFGKMLNAGQTCVAPDFLLVHQDVKSKFLHLLKERIIEIYGEQAHLHQDIATIINETHFQRLINYIKENTVYFGGEYDETSRRIGPTIISDVSWKDKVMKEEIFGPILPVMEFENLDETISELNAKIRPLAAYYFSKNKKKQKKVIESLRFGGGVINDSLFHFGNPELPIGGVGSSGIGQYHGKYSFDTFSHKKSIVKKPYYLDISLRYPPYKGKLKWLRWIFKL